MHCTEQRPTIIIILMSLLLMMSTWCHSPCHAFKDCLKEDRRRVWDDPCPIAEVPESFRKLDDPLRQMVARLKRNNGNKKDDDNDDNAIGTTTASCSNSNAAAGQCNVDNNHRIENEDPADSNKHDDGDIPKLDETDDVCSYVTNAIFAEYSMYDAVLLHHGMCRGGIPAGSFGPHDAMELLPNNSELMTLIIEGRYLMQAITEGIQFAYGFRFGDSFPTTAGIRYHYKAIDGYRVAVDQFEILTPTCGWAPVEEDGLYKVVTNRQLFDNNDGYRALRSAAVSKGKRLGEASVFWTHTESLCRLETAETKRMRRLRRQEEQQRIAEAQRHNQKIIFHVGSMTRTNRTGRF